MYNKNTTVWNKIEVRSFLLKREPAHSCSQAPIARAAMTFLILQATVGLSCTWAVHVFVFSSLSPVTLCSFWIYICVISDKV